MSKMIQIRNVPDATHRKLKAKAATAGLSLSEFLLREAEKTAHQLTLAEMQERLAHRPVQNLKLSPTQAVREERDRR